MDDLEIRRIDECHWKGYLGKNLICEFEYFRDFEGKYWINNIATFDDRKQQGFGTKMILCALAEYKKIYVSTAEKVDIKTNAIKGDFRYTNDLSYDVSELKEFVDKLVQKDILKSEWVRHPFKTR